MRRAGRVAQVQARASTGSNTTRPADEATRNACKVETVVECREQEHRICACATRKERCCVGLWSRGAGGWTSGAITRTDSRFIARTISNGDTHLDECRWLNSGGSRIALIERGKITGWKQISAEEASKVLVQALVAGDAGLLETVMATPAELTEAGVPKDVVAKVAAAAEKRPEQLAALKKQLIGWNAQTIWNRFDGTFPHVIPADPAVGLAKDVTLYENAMVIPGTTAAQQNAAKTGVLAGPRHDPARSDVEVHRAAARDRSRKTDRRRREQHAFDAVRSSRTTSHLATRQWSSHSRLSPTTTRRMRTLLQNGDKTKIARYHVESHPVSSRTCENIQERR